MSQVSPANRKQAPPADLQSCTQTMNLTCIRARQFLASARHGLGKVFIMQIATDKQPSRPVNSRWGEMLPSLKIKVKLANMPGNWNNDSRYCADKEKPSCPLCTKRCTLNNL